MLNKVILIGRLVQDPELRYTPNGVAVAKIRLAVDRPFTNRQGERETDFIDVVTWNKIAENCAKYMGKGGMVAVEGRLQIRSYEDSQNIKRIAAEVVASDVRFLVWPKNDQRAAAGGSAETVKQKPNDFSSEIDFSEDDIPF